MPKQQQNREKQRNDGNDSDDNVSNNLFNQIKQQQKNGLSLCVCVPC